MTTQPQRGGGGGGGRLRFFFCVKVFFFFFFAIIVRATLTATTKSLRRDFDALVVVLNGNAVEDCAIDGRARRLARELNVVWRRRERREGDARVVVVATILLAGDDANDRCERLLERLVSVEEEEKEKKRDDDEESEVVVKYETLPRDATTPIGGPRTRALSVRVNAWVRERREHREEGEEKGGEVYAFVENDSEALMYFAAMSKETRGGATESLYDDVSFATMTGVGFDSDDEEEEKNGAEDGKRYGERC